MSDNYLDPVPPGWVTYKFPLDVRKDRTTYCPRTFLLLVLGSEYEAYQEWLDEHYPGEWMWASGEYHWISRLSTTRRIGMLYFARPSIRAHFKLTWG